MMSSRIQIKSFIINNKIEKKHIVGVLFEFEYNWME